MATYRKAIISYFDILGFGDLFHQGHDPNEIESILNKFKESSGPVIGLPDINKVTTVNFSDLIIRIVFIDKPTSFDYEFGPLSIELQDIALVQANLIDDGILIRGGITISDIFLENGTIFGPGLNRAYRLESTFAQYPRIIVDRDVFSEFDSNRLLWGPSHAKDSELADIKNVLSRDSDGLYFVDYLKFAKDIFPDFEFECLMEAHKGLIISNKDKARHLNSVALKFNWLACYHNQHAEGDFRINSSAFPMLYDL